MNELITEIVRVFWLFLPAGFANMAPVIFKWVNFLNYRIDLGAKFAGKPLFGKNKTFRGFFFGIMIAIFVAYIQKLTALDIIDYSQINVFLLGLLLGFGAVFGDLVKSFFKRRLDIAPGKSWFPFDQIDWILGAVVFLNFYIAIEFCLNLTAIMLFGLLHPLVNYLGYLLRIKKTKF